MAAVSSSGVQPAATSAAVMAPADVPATLVIAGRMPWARSS
jgi:hypothetical protein